MASRVRQHQGMDGFNDKPTGLIAEAERLLAWYDRHRRVLPWRAEAGQTADPYRVWLSEIMLQQTTVATVGPYFQRFIERWPRVEALAAANLDAVLTEWAGLGYYARARNLHKCAITIADRHGGRFPDTLDGLLALPGIGAYTAAAIAAIAFDQPATVVDGNVERVVARLHDVHTPLPGAKGELTRLAAERTPHRRPGDYAQAMMDLGATLCTPRRPRCVLCPFHDPCAARKAGTAEDLPKKSPKPTKPTRYGHAFWVTERSGAVLLGRRPESGLLGGMMEVPSTPWGEAMADDAILNHAPIPSEWRRLPGTVRHTFTHFHLHLVVWVGQAGHGVDLPPTMRWVDPDRLGDEALPTVMRKIARHALAHVS